MSAVNSGCACDSGLMIGRVLRSSKKKVQRGINSRVDGGYRAAGWGFSGRSMLRPYGILLRQHPSGSRKREQAPALHRMSTTIDLERVGYGVLRVVERTRKPKEPAGRPSFVRVNRRHGRRKLFRAASGLADGRRMRRLAWRPVSFR